MTLDFLNQGKSYVRPAELPRSHPGEVFARLVLASTELTRKEIAERLGMSQDYLNRFIDGLEPVTVEFASKLEAEFSISAQAWMNYQQAYDSYMTACDKTP